MPAMRVVLCLLGLAAAIPVFGQDTSLLRYDGPDRVQKVMAAAQKEGALTLYTSFAEKDLPPLLGAFEKRYGIKVKVWRSASEKVLQRIIDGHGRPSDVDLLLDISDNISPGINWPPRQTTICPLGPSAVSPIASAILRFRDEFERYVGGPVETTVNVSGAAYLPVTVESASV